MVIRRFAWLCFALLLVVSGPLAASAQTSLGTPEAGNVAGPQVGDAVSWVGSSGSEVATITVDDIIDPFEDVDPSSTPDRGFHYVALTVTVENTGNAPVNVDPYAFNLVDADGFVSRTAYLYRSTEQTTANPDLVSGEVAAGDTVSGLVGFQVLNGTTPQRVVFNPDSTQLLTLVDQRESRVALGTPVTILGSDGAEVGEVTVNQVFDPFEDYDPSYSPDRGFHFVVIDVSVENTGGRPLSLSTSSFYVVDAEGFYTYATYLYRGDSATPPDFEGGDLAPGDTMTGVIPFQVLNGTEVGSILFSNSLYEQQTIVGEPAAGGDVVAVERSTPTPAPTATNPEDCEGLADWFAPTFARLTEMTTLLTPIGITAATSPGELEVADLQQAADRVNEIAKEQRDAKPPKAGVALNDALVDAYTGVGTALDDLAEAVDGGDSAAIDTAIKALSASGDIFNGDEFNQLADDLLTACPELESLIG